MENDTDSPAGIADGEIEELIRLEAEATPGPWVYNNEYGWLLANGRLIAAMRNALPGLIARLRRAVTERDRLKEALEPFAGMYEKYKYNNDGCLCPAYVSMAQVSAAAEALNPGSTASQPRMSLNMMNDRMALIAKHKENEDALADAGKGGGE